MSYANKSIITYDRRSFFIDGKPIVLLSGSVHYIRVHPTRWNHLFTKFKNAGLNTVETYVFWGEHDHAPDVTLHLTYEEYVNSSVQLDFNHHRDLFGFIKCAANHGLYVILRIGPYVCAEVSYGGFPFRLRTVPSMQLRTYNKPFMNAVATWVKYIASQLHQHQLIASKGGPIILVQLENEYEMVSDNYGEEGKLYLQWVANLRNELNLGIPTFMCFGAADGVVETINSFYAHTLTYDQRKRHPDQPLIWTECWTGWYNVWGAGRHFRPAKDLAYAVTRFFANGGTTVNYYMWMGGTNIGRTPMYLQTTSYDYDAPMNEFYQDTSKSRHITRLHKVLEKYFFPILQRNREKDSEMIDQVIVWDNIAFLCNDTDSPRNVTPLPNGKKYQNVIDPKSVHIVEMDTNKLLFDTACISNEDTISQCKYEVEFETITPWINAIEPIPTSTTAKAMSTGVFKRPIVTSKSPPDQLSLTLDSSDYSFYMARYRPDDDVVKDIQLQFQAADVIQVFIDREWVGGTTSPLWEDRWPNKWNTYKDQQAPGLGHQIETNVTKNEEFEVTVLVGSMGLVKGDWQLGSTASMMDEAKGLRSDVTINGANRISDWTCVGKLLGEVKKLSERLGKDMIENDVEHKNVNQPMWYGCVVRMMQKSDSWVLDLSGVGKGLLWVNGILLGRFWSIEAKRGRNGFLQDSPIEQSHVGDTQEMYHIPGWVLQERKSMTVKGKDVEIDQSAVESNDKAQLNDDTMTNSQVELCLHIVLFVESGGGPSDEIKLFEMRTSMEN